LFSGWISRLSRKGIRRLFLRRGVRSESTIGTIGSLLHYLILMIGFGVALQTLGIDLGALFAAGAIFAIGLGFAMQNIAQNFVSGVILLLERAIKPGDVLYVEGTVVRVTRMGIRATIVQSRDGEDLIVPNSVLAQSTVKNYTFKESSYRLRTSVGVTYDSNLELVREVLEGVLERIDWKLPEPKSQVLLIEFGSSSINFEIALWMNDPWRARIATSELNEKIWFAFQQRGIKIAFPQLDVHFDAGMEEGLRRIGSNG
jgi:small-conductance mechanosensitive channel